ncbi:hypothetical protein QBC35DRAFT_80833 [Podospora australis]|uniref:Uncharacterized protein n=1 Tax=Podospora australis TaxID=1536484 RepID=A0AAN7AKU2_9PEZI|nr:hypothetical protein QBC35DRAFT_80833 [Podospora australis]
MIVYYTGSAQYGCFTVHFTVGLIRIPQFSRYPSQPNYPALISLSQMRQAHTHTGPGSVIRLAFCFIFTAFPFLFKVLRGFWVGYSSNQAGHNLWDIANGGFIGWHDRTARTTSMFYLYSTLLVCFFSSSTVDTISG